jgi:3-mercaptopyruvate sulfurtransferase SseA
MKNRIPLFLFVLTLAILACNAFLPLSAEETPAPLSQPSLNSGLPLTEEQVPRVNVDEAKAAFDSGEAVIVDVRSADAYATSHAAGALSVPLGFFESEIENVDLPKEKWIITYCT